SQKEEISRNSAMARGRISRLPSPKYRPVSIWPYTSSKSLSKQGPEDRGCGPGKRVELAGRLQSRCDDTYLTECLSTSHGRAKGGARYGDSCDARHYDRPAAPFDQRRRGSQAASGLFPTSQRLASPARQMGTSPDSEHSANRVR